MGNTANRDNAFSDIYKATRISIPNEKSDDQIAEDQISILELFISPNKDLCIVILKEKTFTGDFQPIHYIHIYHYDAIQNQFVIVLNYTITDEIVQIDKAVYDPHNNYILIYNHLKEVNEDQSKFFLFKFEYLTRNNPKLGMNGYNMTKLMHPHINFFGKCQYATFLKQATELLLVFEKGHFILLTADESTKEYAHINYFSSRSSFKYLSKKHKKSSTISDAASSSSSIPPSSINTNITATTNTRRKKRNYHVLSVSVHESRGRIAWIECEYSHYYLQILSLKCILAHKRSPSESKEYYSEEIMTNTHNSSSTPYYKHSLSQSLPSIATPINLPEASPTPNNIPLFSLNQTQTPPTDSTPTNTSTPITPSLSAFSKRVKNGANKSHQNGIVKITPISIDMERYLIVSRLIFADQTDMDTIRAVFAEEYDLESRKLYDAQQFVHLSADDYGATKYRGVVRKKSDSLTGNSNDSATKYVLGSFFGIDPSNTKLLFNREGDKILYQSEGRMLHHSYHGKLSHGDQYSGNLNDFGALHVVDVTTANSLWSLGSKSKDVGFGWFNDFLIVLPSINSASGLASSKSLYNPHKKSQSISSSSMQGAKGRHSHLQLFGFLSETSIAETLYNHCDDIEFINEFSWDLCVLLALYCGGIREYRQLSLAKYEKKSKANASGKRKNSGNNGSQNGNGSKCNYTVSDIKLITNEILSVWNVNDNYYTKTREWLVVAMKSFRDTIRYIDIMFYDSHQLVMHEQDIFIPYNNNDGLICRNLLGNSSEFDSLYNASD